MTTETHVAEMPFDGAPIDHAAGTDVPEKFRDPDTGALRSDTLLRSYQELERELSSRVRIPDATASDDERRRFLAATGVPDSPDDYPIDLPEGLSERDPSVDMQLHEAGFTPAQAQLVYDLAAEHLLPRLDDAAAEHEADRQLARLAKQFGGEQAWEDVAGQIASWGEANLPSDAFATLAASAEGVIAMHRMMTSGEPGLIDGSSGDADTEGGLDELREMMRDPRYWRDSDPAWINRVTKGFRRLYPDKG